MPTAILLILSGLSIFKFSKGGINSLEDFWQDDFIGPMPKVDPDTNGAISGSPDSFIDNLSIKESLIGFGLFSVILFSKPWK